MKLALLFNDGLGQCQHEMRPLCIGLVILSGWGVGGALAQSALPSAPAKQELVVGLHDKPPYATYEDGEWHGLGVALWKKIAAKLGYTYRFLPLPYEELSESLRDGKVDVILGEIIVTAAEEERIDFTQPFLQTNVVIAVSREHWREDWLKILFNTWDWNLLRVVLGLMVALVIVTLLIWLAERRLEGGHFTGKTHHGLGSALWFSIVTMSGVGYGDKTPLTFLGRMVTIIWIFCGLLLITAFTAAVASTVASAQTRSEVTGLISLKHQLNGVLAGSNAELILHEERARLEKFETLEGALAALSEGKLDTVVGDGISLQYLIHEDFPKLHLLPVRLSLGHVAIGVAQNSPLREPINVALLEIITTPEWEKLVNQYVGESPQNLK